MRKFAKAVAAVCHKHFTNRHRKILLLKELDTKKTEVCRSRLGVNSKLGVKSPKILFHFHLD